MPTKILYVFKIWIIAVLVPACILTLDFWYRMKHDATVATNYLMNLSTELHLGLYLLFSAIFSLPSWALFLFAVHQLMKRAGKPSTQKWLLAIISSFLTAIAFLPVYILEINQVQWYAPFYYIATLWACIYFFKLPDSKNNQYTVQQDIIDINEIP